ncbi:OmpA family protein [Alicyclobacillus sp.]|uniref:OmpA/MotB family protein n=1 Tax=Alicyclobacillus sp. TaxID=61169 RepID=UPI0025BA6E16|nr:OmpA family protein [Alicyclobacillus sp.]MCL6517821.1 OmpA family protein [Alicyclobacillus sp.]
MRRREGVNWWLSYSDVMSGMVIILVLCLAVVILNVNEKEQQLTQVQQHLQQSEQQVRDIIGVKAEIIQELSAAFRQSNMQIEIDKQTGAIRIPGSVLFDENSAQISPQGEAYLRTFIPKYFGVLLQPKFRNQISAILIEGHTDQQGTYMYNMQLSQARALSVLQYIYSDQFPDFPTRQLAEQYVTCEGWSFTHPIVANNGQVDQDKSRRVEFLFRLKDDEALEQIQKLVGGAS